jgi:CheY-like chemotaxis protein
MKKILIAEDDFFIRDVYGEIFQSNGYEVELASDGEESLIKIKSQPFDMILLDIMMPKFKGIEVLVQTRGQETPNKITPVFFITNVAEQNIIDEAFKAGMDGYIIKSQYNPQQIVDEINKFLKSKENFAVR